MLLRMLIIPKCPCPKYVRCALLCQHLNGSRGDHDFWGIVLYSISRRMACGIPVTTGFGLLAIQGKKICKKCTSSFLVRTYMLETPLNLASYSSQQSLLACLQQVKSLVSSSCCTVWHAAVMVMCEVQARSSGSSSSWEFCEVQVTGSDDRTVLQSLNGFLITLLFFLCIVANSSHFLAVPPEWYR